MSQQRTRTRDELPPAASTTILFPPLTCATGCWRAQHRAVLGIVQIDRNEPGAVTLSDERSIRLYEHAVEGFQGRSH
jgi:hypothetical protein